MRAWRCGLPDKGSKTQTLKPMDTSKAVARAPLMGKEAVPNACIQGGDLKESVWLPNQAVAKAWMEYVKTGAVGDTTLSSSAPAAKRKSLAQSAQKERKVREILWTAA